MIITFATVNWSLAIYYCKTQNFSHFLILGKFRKHVRIEFRTLQMTLFFVTIHVKITIWYYNSFKKLQKCCTINMQYHNFQRIFIRISFKMRNNLRHLLLWFESFRTTTSHTRMEENGALSRCNSLNVLSKLTLYANGQKVCQYFWECGNNVKHFTQIWQATPQNQNIQY